jgi:hypothetical protein
MLHIHKHQPVRTDSQIVRVDQPDGSVRWEPVTYVLRRCSCGDVETEELDGTWSIEDIRL